MYTLRVARVTILGKGILGSVQGSAALRFDRPSGARSCTAKPPPSNVVCSSLPDITDPACWNSWEDGSGIIWCGSGLDLVSPPVWFAHKLYLPTGAANPS